MCGYQLKGTQVIAQYTEEDCKYFNALKISYKKIIEKFKIF